MFLCYRELDRECLQRKSFLKYYEKRSVHERRVANKIMMKIEGLKRNQIKRVMPKASREQTNAKREQRKKYTDQAESKKEHYAKIQI